MSSALARKLQAAIDRIRGKERSTAPGDAWGLSPRDARKRVQPAGELEALFYAHEGRIVQKWHHYLEIYERHFAPLRQQGQPLRILELGVSRGGSLELWRKYFGPNARIVGIDIDPICAGRVDPENTVMIGDQSDPTVLASAIERLGGGVDIVIDDGSHRGRHQIASFEYLYPRISERGVYVCEDLHCSYWEDFEGGYRRADTFIELTKALIDRLHAWYLDDALKASFMDFAGTTYCISSYLSIVVIEKRPIQRPFDVQIGKE
ncbi:MAG: SAM-dependent methyltransferase [Xanthobacteraceae bacterium]